jgi:hypothetical protein
LKDILDGDTFEEYFIRDPTKFKFTQSTSFYNANETLANFLFTNELGILSDFEKFKLLPFASENATAGLFVYSEYLGDELTETRYCRLFSQKQVPLLDYCRQLSKHLKAGETTGEITSENKEIVATIDRFKEKAGYKPYVDKNEIEWCLLHVDSWKINDDDTLELTGIYPHLPGNESIPIGDLMLNFDVFTLHTDNTSELFFNMGNDFYEEYYKFVIGDGNKSWFE